MSSRFNPRMLGVGLLASVLWMSCAQVNAPTGGPVDEDPPVLLSSSPAMGSTSLQPERLVWDFDEFIQLKNTTSEMFLSPPLAGVNALETRVRGRTVEVAFPADADWQTDQTYVLHFGAAIVDLHEGNAADGLLWAFSTGAVLDTLAIVGQVVRSVDAAAVESCRVFAYPEALPLDSVVLSSSGHPSQVAVTDANGRFVLRHLAPGGYRLLAVSDANRDYRWNAGESAALLPNPVQAGDTTLHKMIHGPTAPPFQAPRIAAAERDSAGLMRMAFAGNPVANVAFYRKSGGSLAHFAWADSVWAWSNGESVGDSVVWQWRLGSTSGWDTLRVRDARASLSGRAPALDPAQRKTPRSFPARQRTFSWNRPMAQLDTARVVVRKDSVAQPLDQWAWTSPRDLVVDVEEGAGEHWAMLLLPGAVEDVWGAQNVDTLLAEWSTHPADHAGKLVVALQGLTTPGWLRTSSLPDSVRVEGDTTVVWPQIAPGKVTLTFSSDENGDGEWTSTNPLGWQSAEPRSVLQKELEIRSNWDVELSVDFRQKP